VAPTVITVVASPPPASPPPAALTGTGTAALTAASDPCLACKRSPRRPPTSPQVPPA
jgi:hypothetical protein